MEFKVGDKAVYPSRGVVVVTAVETVEVEGFRGQMYKLKILDNGSSISVPVQNVQQLGMRRIISAEQVDKVYEILRDRDVPADNQTWNRRYREYKDKINTGDLMEVGKVLRDLALLKAKKNLSFGERKMYDEASTLLIQEIAVARDMDEKLIRTEIEQIFAS
jgi:CarD family transcriptional regulator